MKKFMVLFLAAGMLLGGAHAASAIDFKAKGEWLFGFGGGDGSFVSHTTSDGQKTKRNSDDKFQANQRIRLQLDAVASEALSGTVMFQIGDQHWGKADEGGALGADGKVVGILNAYIDWLVPNTDLKVRMGLQPLEVPNVAGGSSVFNDDSAAAIAMNYQFNENIGLTFFWARPYNDNYSEKTAYNSTSNNKNHFLDNEDLFMLSLPMTFEGVEVTPWIMYGMIGSNTYRGYDEDPSTDNALHMTSGFQNDGRWRIRGLEEDGNFERNGNTYHSAFWAGIPVKLTLWDPLNIEFDINYGYSESEGRGWMTRADGIEKRFDTRREGWLAKALVEYKMDWGTPGLFGWYASGDDSNPKNGSERMPAVSPKGNFTNFMGDGNLGWTSHDSWYDRGLNYAGTWGIGLQIADMSFVEDLKHTFRVAYMGGTNSPSMAKYANNSWDWSSDYETGTGDDLYLTTNDGLLEFDFVTSYQMYENFEVNFDVAYVVNMVDSDTWKKANRDTSFDKQDAWRAQLTFAYTF